MGPSESDFFRSLLRTVRDIILEDDPTRAVEKALGGLLVATDASAACMLMKNEDGKVKVLVGCGTARDSFARAIPYHSLAASVFRSGQTHSGEMEVSGKSFPTIVAPVGVGSPPLGLLCIQWRDSITRPKKELTEAIEIMATILGPVMKDKAIVRQTEQAPKEAQKRLWRRMALSNIVGVSDGIVRVIETILRVAPSKAPVLISGESGTGKELVARSIHMESPRASKPFVVVDCGAVSETLLESQLFGHVKGAFTDARCDRKGCFATATGGTLFLDEVSNMSPRLQMKLLRVLQFGEIQPVGSDQTQNVDVRLVAATNRNLAEMVEKGEFRPDLYYRLNVVQLVLPPLRERREDILLLAEHFLKKYAAETRKQVKEFDESAKSLMLGYNWPGNVRQLENVVQSAVLLCTGTTITASVLPLESQHPQEAVKYTVPTSYAELKRAKKSQLDELERLFLVESLRRSTGNVSKAAEKTGVHRTRLEHLLKKHKIEPRAFKEKV